MPFTKENQPDFATRRRRGSGKFSLAHFTRALKREAKRSGKKSAYDHAAQQFFIDNAVMIALMRKLLPDMKQVEITQVADIPEITKDYFKGMIAAVPLESNE